MRKVLCIALFLCLVMLCGCSAADAPEAPMVQHVQPAPTPTVTAASVDETPAAFARGYLAGNVYTNAFAGICITLPDDWTCTDDSALAQLSAYDENGSPLNVTELIAQNELTGSNITVMYETTDATADAYANAIADELVLDEVFHFTAHEPEAFILCGKEYLNLRMTIEDLNREQMYLLRREGDVMIVLILTGQKPDDLAGLFSS